MTDAKLPLLQAANLHRPDVAASPPISLSMMAGEIVGLTGPSGSGKSLMLRAIADLDPAEGSVSLNGIARETIPAPAWRKQVVYLAAESGWWADTVADHMSAPDKAKAMLSKMDLADDALDWPVARLSSGEKQRLALIRGLIMEPKILLLDEPTAALDEARRDKAEALITAFTQTGGAVVLVSHDPSQIERLCSEAVALGCTTS